MESTVVIYETCADSRETAINLRCVDLECSAMYVVLKELLIYAF